MTLNLLNSFGKKGVSYGLDTLQSDVSDSYYLSKYFVISEFDPKFSVGRNSFALNGSNFLKPNSEILVECIDSKGNNLYIEMASISGNPTKIYAYKESTSFVLSIHVYNDTAEGIGKLICWGNLLDGRTVKWQQNITIDKTLKNSSRVRFYTRPKLEINSVLVPVLNSTISSTLKQTISFGGQLHGIAVNPPKDTNLPTVNRRNVDIDYRLICDTPEIDRDTLDYSGFNSQMIGSTVQLFINKIQIPYSNTDIAPTDNTRSFIISDIIDNKTLKLSDPYFYSDNKNNELITNISNAGFNISYPYISYNTITSSYQTSNIDGVNYVIKNSYADVIYKNIRTFTGFIARHKLYRKSLLTNSDFSIIADEPLFINELLRDNLTQNKFYEKLGKFYNDDHINRYWFVNNSDNLKIVHSPDVFIDSAYITSSNYNNLNGDDYIIVKNDSTGNSRNSNYIPFDSLQFNETSGSSYDSNFIQLKSEVQYLLQVDVTIEKDVNSTDSAVEFYFTSSIPEAKKDVNFTNKHGIRLATLFANDTGNLNHFDKQYFFYTPQSDLYGTLVIVPYKCQAYLKNISFRIYGDDGFSPDTFISRIPWPITVENETFQIKSEMFDINHNLVYSDLQTFQNFDPSGSSLIPYTPGGGTISGLGDTTIGGNLIVSKSLYVETGDIIVEVGNLIVPEMDARSVNQISGSRILAKVGTGAQAGKIVYTNIVDLRHDDEYIYLSTGSMTILPSETSNIISTVQSITSRYYRKIYWNNLGKQEESL